MTRTISPGRLASGGARGADAITYARLFVQAGGPAVLADLQRRFLDRRVAPTCRDAELWFVEGQRSVVAHLLATIERGRASAPAGNDPLPSTGAADE